jgi:hypothetical protein
VLLNRRVSAFAALLLVVGGLWGLHAGARPDALGMDARVGLRSEVAFVAVAVVARVETRMDRPDRSVQVGLLAAGSVLLLTLVARLLAARRPDRRDLGGRRFPVRLRAPPLLVG